MRELLRYQELPEKGIGKLREILQRGSNGLVLVDLDDTVKEPKKYLWSDGVSRRLFPETVAAFFALHCAGMKIGIVTEQAFAEILPFVRDIAKLALGSQVSSPYEFFDGLIVGEGGSVVKAKDDRVVIVAPEQSIWERSVILEWLSENVQEVPGMNRWGILSGVDPDIGSYVKLPGEEDQGVATLSLWEKGPHIGLDPSFVSRYSVIENVVRGAMIDLGLDCLTTYEAGNGTLRIVPRYINKAHTTGLLSVFGNLDLGQVVYACDGPNDIEVAEKIKNKGGGIIAVANAVPRLHEISDFSSSENSGMGFAEAIRLLFPFYYQNAASNLAERGLFITV